jgi:DNA-binding NarL/FixJ family response regulator
MKKIHLLLVDDQVLFVESLKRVIEAVAPDMSVDAIAENGEVAVSAAEQFRPDVVLMDIRMPTMDGVEATRLIRQRLPDTQIIILTTYDDDEYVQNALHAGAVGYLLKDIRPEELAGAVRAVGNGAFLISPMIAKRLLLRARENRDQEPGHPRQVEVPPWLTRLSKREKEILYLIANGMSNKEIANTVFVAEQTIKNHVSAIYSKIGNNDRFRVIELIRECLEKGYLQAPQTQDSGRTPQ